MAENFPNLKKETDIQVQEAQKMNQIRWTQTDPHQDISQLQWQKLEIKREF